jgi:hypothetical protein
VHYVVRLTNPSKADDVADAIELLGLALRCPIPIQERAGHDISGSEVKTLSQVVHSYTGNRTVFRITTVTTEVSIRPRGAVERNTSTYDLRVPYQDMSDLYRQTDAEQERRSRAGEQHCEACGIAGNLFRLSNLDPRQFCEASDV